MTYEEFMALPDDGKHYELIEGELCLNAAPFPRHQRIARSLFRRLDRYFEEHGGGEVWFAPLDFVLSRENVLEPDLAVILSERASIVGERNVEGAPDIAIEVLSAGTRRKDRVVKRRLYEQYGVGEIWLVDPHDRSVTIIRGGVEIVVTDAITSPLLPRFTMPVRDVFPG
ncbi:MAG TPA: Uma2 family endonuclease [Thermoanaerobaculia bacterium]|nr:Uma2 family endonuclease [Thermoanaerobaculia bacterium]